MLSTNDDNLNSIQYFYANKHKMLAVDVGKVNGERYTFWYENTIRAFEIFGPNRSKSAKRYLDLTNEIDLPILSQENIFAMSDKELLDEFKKLEKLNVNPVILDENRLKKLNIFFEDQKICYNRYYTNSMTITRMGKRYTTTEFVTKSLENKGSKVQPVHISDKFGKTFRMQTVNDGQPVNLDLLIPIYVASGEEYYLSDYLLRRWHPDCIFWYEPTPQFLAILPREIRKQIVYELSTLDTGTSFNPDVLPSSKKNDSITTPKNCVYLNPCADVKINIEEFKLYPNPARNNVNLKIDTDLSVSGKIVITNLTGKEVKNLELEDISASLTIDISNLASGIYLVTLITDYGDKLTRRMIKK